MYETDTIDTAMLSNSDADSLGEEYQNQSTTTTLEQEGI